MDDNAAETGSVSSQEGYAFLNYSPDTVKGKLPPNVDKKEMARQKRKRTSPEDQAVLEAAYNRDPKPDKTARLELVKQVALGEKEVQIWFQNRRQSSRRKSRPLLPHEIAQYQMSRAGLSTSSPESTFAPAGHPQRSPENDEHPTPEVRQLATMGRAPDGTTSIPTDSSVLDRSLPSQEPASSLSQVVDSLQSARDGVALASSQGPQRDLTHAAESHTGSSAAVGYLANRRSASSRLSDQSLYSIPVKAESDRRLKKSASVVRLSLNAEGKAEIVTKNISSPSPPRPQQAPVVTGATTSDAPLPFPRLPAAKKLQRSSSGRSRDSRSWEFWCDKEARSELGNAAAKDSTGSAAGAIGLLRTASGRNVLGSIPSKRNFAVSHQHESAKRTKLGHRRPQLQRSHTSLGRLQGKVEGPVSGEVRPKLKHSESAASVQLKGNDSDKENWSPDPEGDAEGSNNEFQRSRVDQAPIDRRRLMNRHSQTSQGPKKGQHSDVSDPEDDPELAAFMGGSRKNTGVSEHEDFDCIQGLLSLSQGNWR